MAVFSMEVLSAELWIGLTTAAIVLLSTTVNLAIRHASRVELSDRLEKRGRAQLLSKLLDQRNELLFTSSLIRLSAILALVLLIAHLFGTQPQSGTKPTTQYTAIFITSMTLISVIGVALPSSWARYGGNAFLTATLPFILLLQHVLYPLVAFHHLLDGLVRRLAGIPKTDEQQAEVDQIGKEILGAVTEGELVGAVHEEDADMIESVMEFRETDVRETMTPRTEIVALPATATLDEAKEMIASEGHSRIPIYGENIDDILGVLYAKDLLKLTESEHFDPLKMMRKVPFVPETKRIPDLLTELREQKVHLAIVLDEYGGTAGLVTLEDILEEIVGEIADEYEVPEPDPIRRIAPNTLEVDARVHIDEINEELRIQLPDDEEYDTVGGFVFSTMGKIPTTGEELSYQNVHFRVIDAEERKINWLRIEVTPNETPA